jgi:hypothetical protein
MKKRDRGSGGGPHNMSEYSFSQVRPLSLYIYLNLFIFKIVGIDLFCVNGALRDVFCFPYQGRLGLACLPSTNNTTRSIPLPRFNT